MVVVAHQICSVHSSSTRRSVKQHVDYAWGASSCSRTSETCRCEARGELQLKGVHDPCLHLLWAHARWLDRLSVVTDAQANGPQEYRAAAAVSQCSAFGAGHSAHANSNYYLSGSPSYYWTTVKQAPAFECAFASLFVRCR
eukprot:GHRR01018128.1.p1 GENE.GHRR01018128.1~~GHRR01018128.1.p1  ORF type:complete len:141 (+),score=12.47 GHRR01018128.1:94-516(+)